MFLESLPDAKMEICDSASIGGVVQNWLTDEPKRQMVSVETQTRE
jgi:hypothetical protein